MIYARYDPKPLSRRDNIRAMIHASCDAPKLPLTGALALPLTYPPTSAHHFMSFAKNGDFKKSFEGVLFLKAHLEIHVLKTYKFRFTRKTNFSALLWTPRLGVCMLKGQSSFF